MKRAVELTLTELAAGLLAAAGVTYSLWILDIWLDSGVDPMHGYVSELAALDRRYGELYRSGDLVTAVLVGVAVCTLLAQEATRGSRWTRLGHTALAVFAIATFLDSRVPMTCATSVVRKCAASESSALNDMFHALFSGTALTAILISAGCFLITLRTAEQRRWLRTLSLGVIALVVGSTVWTLAATVFYHHQLLYVGLAQRLQLFAVSAWLLVTAIQAVTCSQGSSPSRSPKAG